MKKEKTYTATIHVGLKCPSTLKIQPFLKARELCQGFVDAIGECVSFTKTEYIYTYGNEPGVIVQFIQYPRFPKPEEEIKRRAIELARILMTHLNQMKVCVIFPDETVLVEKFIHDITFTEKEQRLENEPVFEEKKVLLADDISHKWLGYFAPRSGYHNENVKSAMIEYTKIHVNAALLAAASNVKMRFAGEGVGHVEIDKESILKAYPESNIQ